MADNRTGRVAVDIETFPMLSHLWRMWQSNALDLVKESVVCCYSAKWLDTGEHITRALPDFRGYKPGSEDDRRLIDEMWKLLDRAEIVIWHNGDKFDRRQINARIIKHDQPPPSPYQQVDTLKIARKHFAFPSNRLDALGEFLGVGRKHDTGGYKLWKECMAGNEAAWAKMRRYNRQDVTLLEKVYYKLLPWTNTHPNRSTMTGTACCPKCGSTKLRPDKTVRAATRTYPRFQCMRCLGWCRGVESTEVRASLVSVA